MFDDIPQEHEYHRLGNNYYRLGQFDDAIVQYTRAIQINANMPESWFNRALANARLGNYEAALSDASEVIRLNPQNPDGYYLRGRVNELLLEDVAAISDFERAVKLNPEHVGAENHLRQIIERRWMYEDLREFRDRVSSESENGWLYFQYGKKLAEVGHQDDAVRALERARASGFASPELWRELGEAYVAQNAPVQAMTAFRQSIRGNPTEVIPYAHLGQLLNEAGHYRDAVDVFEQALGMPHEDEASLRCGLGTAYVGTARLDDAQQAFERALELRTNMAEAALGLATVAWRRGDVENASTWCRQARDQDPRLVPAVVLSVNIAVDQDNLLSAAGSAIQAFKSNPANTQLAYLLWALYSYSQKHYRFHASEAWRTHGNLVERARYLVLDYVMTRRALEMVRRGVSDRLIETCPIADEAAELLYQRLANARADVLTVLYAELGRGDLIPIVDRLRRAAKYAEQLDRASIANLCDSYAIMLSSSPEVPRMEVVHRVLERLTQRNVRHADVLHDLYRAILAGLTAESIEDAIYLRPRFERLALATARDGFVLPKIAGLIVDLIRWLDVAEHAFSVADGGADSISDRTKLADSVTDIRMRLAQAVNPPEEWAFATLLTHFGTLMRHHETGVRD